MITLSTLVNLKQLNYPLPNNVDKFPSLYLIYQSINTADLSTLKLEQNAMPRYRNLQLFSFLAYLERGCLVELP